MTSSTESPPRVLGLVLRYLAERRAVLGAASVYRYRNILMELARTVGADLDARLLTRGHVETWIASRNVSDATRYHELGIVRQFAQWAAEHEYVLRDWSLGVRRPRPPRPRPDRLPLPEIRQLIDACPDSRARLVVLLALHLGCTRLEIACLRVDDLDMDRRAVAVRGRNGERVLPIPDELRVALDTYLAEYPATAGPLIRNYDRPTQGITPAHISSLVGKTMRAAGLKRAPYDGRSAQGLRRTAAHEILDSGADIIELEQVLGHATLAATEAPFAPWPQRELREAVGGRTYRSTRRQAEPRAGRNQQHEPGAA